MHCESETSGWVNLYLRHVLQVKTRLLFYFWQYFWQNYVFWKTSDCSSSSENPAPLSTSLQGFLRTCCQMGKFSLPCLSKIRVKQPPLAYCPLIDHVLCSVAAGGVRGLGASRRELLGNCIFSLIMGSWGPARSALEASGPWRWWWYQDIINTETKPPPPPPHFVSSLIGLPFQLINIAQLRAFLVPKIFNLLIFLFR